jgi:hypothetical protein
MKENVAKKKEDILWVWGGEKKYNVGTGMTKGKKEESGT